MNTFKLGDTVVSNTGHRGTVGYVGNDYMAVDFVEGTPDPVANGNCFHLNGRQYYPSHGKAASIRPAPTLDLTKPVQTRSGRPARIVATDRTSRIGRSIVALVTGSDGHENTITRLLSGRTSDSRESPSDLVNVPVRTTVYYPLASGGAVNGSPSDNADDAKVRSTIAKALAITLDGIIPVSAEIV